MPMNPSKRRSPATRRALDRKLERYRDRYFNPTKAVLTINKIDKKFYEWLVDNEYALNATPILDADLIGSLKKELFGGKNRELKKYFPWFYHALSENKSPNTLLPKSYLEVAAGEKKDITPQQVRNIREKLDRGFDNWLSDQSYVLGTAVIENDKGRTAEESLRKLLGK